MKYKGGNIYIKKTLLGFLFYLFIYCVPKILKFDICVREKGDIYIRYALAEHAHSSGLREDIKDDCQSGALW